MAKIELPPSEGLYPVPVVLVSCREKSTQKDNIITIAWCGTICSNPPLLSISIRPSRHSHKIIEETGDFVVNIPTSDIVRKVDICGIKSGRDVDKFALCGFSKTSSSKISSPIITECPVNIECVLKGVTKLGAHDMFTGEIVAIHADQGVLNAGRIDFKKAKPFVYNQGEYWDINSKIGFYGYSK